MISKIIIGKVSESEEKYPLHITFVFKTGDEVSGYTKSTKKKNVIDKYIENESNGNIRNNECLNIQCDTNDMCPNIEYDACGVRNKNMSEKIVEILEFTCFVNFF